MQDPGCVTWVDVRSAAAFEENRIPGSIRIPLFAVKTKGFLRTRSIVLVDEGAGSESLEEEVRKMRKMGFAHVTIWYGGLHAWREIGDGWKAQEIPASINCHRKPSTIFSARPIGWWWGWGSTHPGCRKRPWP